MQKYYIFAAIIRIGDANAVRRAEALLCCKPAASEYSAKISFGYGKRNARSDFSGSVRRDRDAFGIQAGI